MIKLNVYITEAWGGVKKHTNNAEIESWCEDMGIKNYIINFKGEIDVYGDVYLRHNTFKELPYKFGKVNGFFTLMGNKNLISLKNCPNFVDGYFDVDDCIQLDSLEGCPKEVKRNFCCNNCKRKFTKEEVQYLCDVKRNIYV